MLSVHHIERHFRHQHWEPLLRGVSPCVTDLPLPLHVRLSQQPAAVIALALRRVVELTYGPTTLSADLTDALLAHRRPDGSFDGDPLATAAAADALARLIAEHLGAASRLADAHHRAVDSLAAMQDGDGLFAAHDDRTTQDRAMSSAFILSLLAGHEPFRQSVRFGELLGWFADRDDALPAEVRPLWMLAQIEAPAAHRNPTAALAAIAA